jgi:hypothetical protein
VSDTFSACCCEDGAWFDLWPIPKEWAPGGGPNPGTIAPLAFFRPTGNPAQPPPAPTWQAQMLRDSLGPIVPGQSTAQESRAGRYDSYLRGASHRFGRPPLWMRWDDVVRDLFAEALDEPSSGAPGSVNRRRDVFYCGSLPGTGGAAWHFFTYRGSGGIRRRAFLTTGTSGNVVNSVDWGDVSLPVQLPDAWNDETVASLVSGIGGGQFTQYLPRLTRSGFVGGDGARIYTGRTAPTGSIAGVSGWRVTEAGAIVPVVANATPPSGSTFHAVPYRSTPLAFTLYSPDFFVPGPPSLGRVYPRALGEAYLDVQRVLYATEVATASFQEEDGSWTVYDTVSTPYYYVSTRQGWWRGELTGRGGEIAIGEDNDPFMEVEAYGPIDDNEGGAYGRVYSYSDTGNNWAAVIETQGQELVIEALPNIDEVNPETGIRSRVTGRKSISTTIAGVRRDLIVNGRNTPLTADLGVMPVGSPLRKLVDEDGIWKYHPSEAATTMPVLYEPVSEVIAFHGDDSGAVAVALQPYRHSFTQAVSMPSDFAAVYGVDYLFFDRDADIVGVVRSHGCYGEGVLVDGLHPNGSRNVELVSEGAWGTSDRWLYVRAETAGNLVTGSLIRYPSRVGLRIGRNMRSVRRVDLSYYHDGSTLPAGVNLDDVLCHPVRTSVSAHQTAVPYSDTSGRVGSGQDRIDAATAAYEAWLATQP